MREQGRNYINTNIMIKKGHQNIRLLRVTGCQNSMSSATSSVLLCPLPTCEKYVLDYVLKLNRHMFKHLKQCMAQANFSLCLACHDVCRSELAVEIACKLSMHSWPKLIED